MRRRTKTCISLATTLAVLASCGMHLAVLQGIAYSSMVLDFSKESSFTESVKRTVSGQEPCRLCCAVQEMSQEQNQDHEAPPETHRVWGVLSHQAGVYYLPRLLQILPTTVESKTSPFREPPLRPS